MFKDCGLAQPTTHSKYLIIHLGLLAPAEFHSIILDIWRQPSFIQSPSHIIAFLGHKTIPTLDIQMKLEHSLSTYTYLIKLHATEQLTLQQVLILHHLSLASNYVSKEAAHTI